MSKNLKRILLASVGAIVFAGRERSRGNAAFDASVGRNR